MISIIKSRNRSIIIFFLSAVLLFSACKRAYEEILPDNPFIEYTGRIDFSDKLRPEFTYSGISICAAFEGTGISVILNDDQSENEYYALLNGHVVKRFRVKKGRHTYTVAANLPDTIHVVEIIRLTECVFGKTRFEGFFLDRGKSLVPMRPKRDLLFEFVGNSITCGYGNEGTLDDSFSAATENHFNTYAAITSRAFDARHMAVCRSGIGIYRNYDGPTAGSEDCMPNIYKQIHYNDTISIYDFKEKPDLIFINLGTNDFSTLGCDSALFVDAYLNFIETIQGLNDGSDIICLLGTMLSGEDLIKARTYLKAILDNSNNKDLGNTYFFEMSEQLPPLGVDYHPSDEQHLKNAGELIEFIKNLKGWNVYEERVELIKLTLEEEN